MFRRLLLLITVLSTAALAAGCETEVREANINQEQYINDYIEKNYADYEVVRNQGSNRIVLADTLKGVPAIEKGDSSYLYLVGFIFGQNGPQGYFVQDSGMFRVGTGDLIQGLDRGLIGAHLGEEALVLFPAQLGYGNQAVGLVPENTALMFDVFVAAIKKD
jgi:FKBP-type peptidyl-prolyl cis-trans isomerase 2